MCDLSKLEYVRLEQEKISSWQRILFFFVASHFLHVHTKHVHAMHVHAAQAHIMHAHIMRIHAVHAHTVPSFYFYFYLSGTHADTMIGLHIELKNYNGMPAAVIGTIVTRQLPL
jgi:hypothetical protein